jgi:hypothetical protein
LLYTLTSGLLFSEGYHVLIATNIRGNRRAGKLNGNKRKYVQGKSGTAQEEADRINSWDFFPGTVHSEWKTNLPFHLKTYKMDGNTYFKAINV